MTHVFSGRFDQPIFTGPIRAADLNALRDYLAAWDRYFAGLPARPAIMTRIPPTYAFSTTGVLPISRQSLANHPTMAVYQLHPRGREPSFIPHVWHIPNQRIIIGRARRDAPPGTVYLRGGLL